jgi:hypothetical protein
MPGASPGEKQAILAQRKYERSLRDGVPVDFRIKVPMANILIRMKGPDVAPIVNSIGVTNIPSITFAVNDTHDMSQYIFDPAGLRTSTSINGVTNGLLPGGFASYDSSTERLTGVASGTEAGLQLTVSDE